MNLGDVVSLIFQIAVSDLGQNVLHFSRQGIPRIRINGKRVERHTVEVRIQIVRRNLIHLQIDAGVSRLNGGLTDVSLQILVGVIQRGLKADSTRSLDPLKVDAGSANLHAIDVFKRGDALGAVQAIRVGNADADEFLIILGLVVRRKLRILSVNLANNLRDNLRVRAGERHTIYHRLQREAGGFKDEDGAADINQTILYPLDFVAKRDDRTAIGLNPLNFVIGFICYALGNSRNKIIFNCSNPRVRLGVTGTDAQSDLLLASCRCTATADNRQHESQDESHEFL